MTARRSLVFTEFWPSPATPSRSEISSLLLEIARSSYTENDGALITAACIGIDPPRRELSALSFQLLGFGWWLCDGTLARFHGNPLSGIP
jgi:hypothetical protein